MQEKDMEKLLRQIEEHCGDDADLTARYRHYAQVDAEAALLSMRQRMHPGLKGQEERRISRWYRYRWAIAAIIAAVLVNALAWYLYTRVTPPTLSPEIKQAMTRSEQGGFQKAEIERLLLNRQWDGIAKKMYATSSVQKSNPSVPDQGLGEEANASVEELLAMKRVTTHQNKEFWLILPDSSLVHLNYNTHVIYPEQFIGETRDIVLDGEAYFMVAQDRRHPFIVHTPQGDIQQYGTEFNVNTREAGGTASVVLVKGSIGITPTGHAEQRITPGQRFSFSATHAQKEEVDIAPYIAWNTGTFVFDNCTLRQLTDVLDRWYGCQTSFDAEATQEMLFTGELDKYASILPTLDAIEAVTGLTVEYSNKQITISQRK